MNKEYRNRFTQHYRNGAGFTLVELLTVIAIISILTGLFTVSYLSVRVRSRDVQRKSDVKQIQSALELFRADNDSYPSTVQYGVACGSVLTYNSVTYLPKMPCDPSTATRYSYIPSPSSCVPATAPCTSYHLVACIENTGDLDSLITVTQPTGAVLCTPAKYYDATNP